MSAELLPDEPGLADELLHLRRDNRALQVALEDKCATIEALRLMLDRERRECAERVEDAARRIAMIREAITAEYFK